MQIGLFPCVCRHRVVVTRFCPMLWLLFIDITNLLASIELLATSSVLLCCSLCTSKNRLVLSRVKSTAICWKRVKMVFALFLKFYGRVQI